MNDPVENVLDSFLNNKAEGAADYMDKISNMLGDTDRYGFAEDTLIGIYNHIDRFGEVSQKQKDAVDNIKQAGHERRTKRRR